MAKSPTRKTQTRKPSASKASAKAPEKPVSGQPGATPILEWVAAAIGLLLLIGTVSFIAVEAFHPDRSPPEIVVEQLSIEPAGDGYLVSIRATNKGGSAAAQVVVEGELATGEGEPEVAEATFDFVADHSSRDGGLFFEADPRQGGLTLRAKGYAAP